MKLQELIKIQEGILGQKLQKAAEEENGIETFVAMIVDHQAEAMVEAWKLGMKEKEEMQKILPGGKLPPLIFDKRR